MAQPPPAFPPSQHSDPLHGDWHTSVNLMALLDKSPRAVSKQLQGAHVSDSYIDDAEDADDVLYMAKVIAYDLPGDDDLMVSYVHGKARKVTLDNSADNGLGFFQGDAYDKLTKYGLHVASLADNYEVKGAEWDSLTLGYQVNVVSYDNGIVWEVRVQNFFDS